MENTNDVYESPIEIGPIEGCATNNQLCELHQGASAEFKVLNTNLENLYNFIAVMSNYIRYWNNHDNIPVKNHNEYYIHNPDLKSTEAAAQHIGYLESKIMESIETIDKIALELATQIDKVVNKNDTETANRTNS